MHSTPERNRKDDKRTRFEQYGEGHPYTCLPDVDGFEYLTSALIEVGICDQSGMGLGPLTWSELDSFAKRTGDVYTDWEIGLLRQMSSEYAKWHSKGGKQGDIAEDVPYVERNEETLARMQERLIESREKSAELAKEALS
jgi:hypothetical protein